MSTASCAAPHGQVDENAIHGTIARRARELWRQRGCIDGHAEEDWAQAEAEIRAQLASGPGHRYRLILVKAGGVLYTGEYDPGAAGAYRPGELQAGSPVSVHLENDRMPLKLPDGKEVEARVVGAERT